MYKGQFDYIKNLYGWLRLRAPNAGGLGSIPGQGTRSRIPKLRGAYCN